VIRWEHAPGPYEVVFSTRAGGVSEGPFASLNLGRATADEPERVDENRRRLCAEVGADPDALAMNYQHHSTDVLQAKAGSRGERGDGLWTDERGLPLLALAADCLPIALARANGGKPALAVLHAGWRGLLGGIASSGVQALGGGCQTPVGALASPAGGETLSLTAVVVALDGSRAVRGQTHGPRAEAADLGARLGAQLIADGADEILADARHAQGAVEGIQP